MLIQKKKFRVAWLMVALSLVCTAIAFQPVKPAKAQPGESYFKRVRYEDELTDGTYLIVNYPGEVGPFHPLNMLNQDEDWVTVGGVVDGLLEILEADGLPKWTLTFQTNGSNRTAQLTDSSNKVIAPKGGKKNGIKSANSYFWEVKLFPSTGQNIETLRFKGVSEDEVTLASNNNPTTNGYKARAYTNRVNWGNGLYPDYILYKLVNPDDIYIKIAPSNLVSGKYVLMSDKKHAPTILNSGWVDHKDIGIDPATIPALIYHEPPVWTLEVFGNKVLLKDAEGKYIKPSTSNALGELQATDDPFFWDIEVHSDGTVSFTHDNGKRYFASNHTTGSGDNRFRQYLKSSLGNNYRWKFYLFQDEVFPSSVDDNKALFIHEAYGGGGNVGAIWKYDYVILYNRGSQAIQLDGYYLHYASVGGQFSSSHSTPLTGEIGANSFYVIQQSKGNAGSIELGWYHAAGEIQIEAQEFKIALTNSPMPPTRSDDPSVIDFLGVGSADDFLIKATPKLPGGNELNQRAVRRKDSFFYNYNYVDYARITLDANSLDYLDRLAPDGPKFLQSPSEPWIKADGHHVSLNFQLRAENDKLKEAKVGNQLLDQGSYSTMPGESGKTHFALKASYLNDLDPGDYEVELSFGAGSIVRAGEASTNFSVRLALEYEAPPSSWTRGGEDLVFQTNSDGAIGWVEIDGSRLDGDTEYQVESKPEGLQITLPYSYLETLASGSHSLKVSFGTGSTVAGGEIATDFSVLSPLALEGTTEDWIKGQSGGLTLKPNGNLDDLLSVKLGNSNLVLDTHYSVDQANGLITLEATYLDTLEAGSHSLTLTYEAGSTVDGGTISVIFGVFDRLTFIDPIASSWTRGDSKGLTFQLNGNLNYLEEVKVDEKFLVRDEDYEVKAGSTFITLKIPYLNSLGLGSHNFHVSFNTGGTVAGGEVDTEFTINPAPTPPATTAPPTTEPATSGDPTSAPPSTEPATSGEPTSAPPSTDPATSGEPTSAPPSTDPVTGVEPTRTPATTEPATSGKPTRTPATTGEPTTATQTTETAAGESETNKPPVTETEASMPSSTGSGTLVTESTLPEASGSSDPSNPQVVPTGESQRWQIFAISFVLLGAVVLLLTLISHRKQRGIGQG